MSELEVDRIKLSGVFFQIPTNKHFLLVSSWFYELSMTMNRNFSTQVADGFMDQTLMVSPCGGKLFNALGAQAMKSQTCACKSLEVPKQCSSERISRLGLFQVSDVLYINPVCLVLSDCWGMSDISDYDLIHIFGENNCRVQDFPGSVGWNLVKEFCSTPISDVGWKFPKGVNVRWTSILSKTVLSPKLFPSLFLCSSCPSCSVSLPVLNDDWLCDVWLTSIFLSFWFIILCHNDSYLSTF